MKSIRTAFFLCMLVILPTRAFSQALVCPDAGKDIEQNKTEARRYFEPGFHDLNGNVWEWVWDWYGLYPAGTVTDYRGPASGTIRMERGGHWFSIPSVCTVATRYHGAPYDRSSAVGFRVVRP
jgi:formylglycine-generating enzyme required for sulfatase activity